MPQEAVLIVGGGPLQEAVVDAVHARGLAALVTDRNPQCHCAGLADQVIALDTYDHASHRTLRAALSTRWHVRGVCTAGADVGPSVAAAAEALGTPGIPFAVAQLTHHKLDVRGALTGAGLDRYQPAYRRLDLSDPRQPYLALRELRQTADWPFVLKPLESCASRGVSLVYPGLGHWGDGLADAISRARPYGSMAILEEGLTGTEHSAEVIFDGRGAPIFLNVVDRLFRYDDGIPLELGHVNPSRLPKADWTQIQGLLVEAAQALGVTWGPFKCDLMLTADGPKILECTARLSGGWDSQCTTPWSSGRRPIDIVVDLACGVLPRPEDLLYWRHDTAACLAAFPSPGYVRSIRSLDAADLPGVARLIVGVRPGEVIAPYTNCATRPAFAISVDPDPAIALARAMAAAAQLADAIETEGV